MVTSQESDETRAHSDPTQWVDRHGDALYRYAYVRTRDAALAEDLVQETLLAALGAAHTFAGAAAERTWLIAILKNKVIDHQRRAKRETALDDEAVDAEIGHALFDERGHWTLRPRDWGRPQEALESQQFWQVLEACLRGLPSRLAEAFLLREFDGLTAEDVCKVLALTPSNLWVSLHRARTRLRLCLEMQWFDRETE